MRTMQTTSKYGFNLQKVIAFALAITICFSALIPRKASAVTPSLIIGAASLAVSVVQAYQAYIYNGQSSQAEDAFTQLQQYFTTSYYDYGVEVSADDLWSAYMDLRTSGVEADVRQIYHSQLGYVYVITAVTVSYYTSSGFGSRALKGGSRVAFCDGSRYTFCSKTLPSPKILDSIDSILSNINSKLSTVDSHISTLNTNMGNGFSSIVSKLDSLISSTSISVGHLNSIVNTLNDFTLYLESFHFDLSYLSTISSTLTEINDKLSSGSSDSFDPDFDLPADSDVYDYLFGFSSQLASIKKAITDFSDSYYLTNTMGIDIDTSLITQFLYEHSDFFHLSDKLDTLITGQTAAADTLSANIRAIQCLISTGHDWNVDNTLSRFNSSVTISDSTANRLQGISLYGKTIQANTPSLNNPVDISYIDFPKLDISDSDGSVSYSCTFPISLNGIPVSSGGNYIDSFGQHWSADVLRASSASGTAEIERHVQSISVTGEENWVLDASLSNDAYQTFYCQNIFPNRWDGNWEASFCNYLPSGNAYVSSSRKTCFMLRGSSSNRILLLRLPISVVSSVSDLKALLADFAAAGKPLVVYSVLETPITESVDYSVYDLLFRAPLFEGSTSFSLDTDADMELEYVSHSGATFTAHAYADTVSCCRNCGYLAHVPVGQVADQNLFYSLFIRLDAINETLRNASYPSADLSALSDRLDTMIAQNTVVVQRLERIDESINALEIYPPEDSVIHDILVLSPGTDTEEEETITGFSADLFKSGGKLLGVLYRVVFKDALGGIDSSLDGFEDFYIGGSAPEGGVDVWD